MPGQLQQRWGRQAAAPLCQVHAGPRGGGGCRTTAKGTDLKTNMAERKREEEAFYSTKQLSQSRAKPAEAPQPLPRAATRRFAFGSVQGESRGHVGASPSQPAANGSVRWNLCAPGSEPAAPAPTHPPFSSAKDKPTTSRWSFGGGRGGALERKRRMETPYSLMAMSG